MSGDGGRALGRHRASLLLIRLAAMLPAIFSVWLCLALGAQVRVAADSAGAFYQVYAPKSICPGETATVRLVVQLPAGYTPLSILMVPAQLTQPTPDYRLSGSLDPCQRLWGRLHASNLEIVGATAVQRTLQASSTEWTWDIYCPPGIPSPSRSALTILLFARQADANGALVDIPLKDIRFEVPVTTQKSAGMSSSLLSILLLLGVAALLAAGWLRKRSDPNGEKRVGGHS